MAVKQGSGIYISYSREDKDFAVKLARDLKESGFAAWLDQLDIPPGARWDKEVEKALKDFSTFLVILTPASTSSQNVRDEIGYIIDNGKNVLPILLKQAEIPIRLRRFQYVDFTNKDYEAGFDEVVKVLNQGFNIQRTTQSPRAKQARVAENVGAGIIPESINVANIIDSGANIINIYSNTLENELAQERISILYFEPETVLIPAGSFLMGANPAEGIPGYETPRHEVMLPAYRIGKYPITNAQYEQFVRSTSHSVAPGMGWAGQQIHEGTEKLPVIGVTWYDAMAYCEWLSKKTGRKYTLPNEAQWEKVCRGGKNALYPWGDELDPKRSNHGNSTIAAVDAYPVQNEYGCFDLVGNVRQWTCTLWGEKRVTPDYMYPWHEDGRNNLSAGRQIRRVVRSSSFQDSLELMRCSARTGQLPDDSGTSSTLLGIRVVMIGDQSNSSQSIPPQKVGRYEIKSEISRGGRELQNPYVGPRTFTREEAHLFFGREREANELLALVENEQLVLFYAQSGAGKSSLINTCLIPDLERDGYQVLPIGRVSGELSNQIDVSNIFVFNLIRSLDRYDIDPIAVPDLLLTQFMDDLGSSSESVTSQSLPRVLIIDQFEELFSAHPESWKEREGFFRELAQTMQDHSQLRVVLAMREDYIASLDPYTQFVPNGFQARYYMQQMERETALHAITGPVEGIRPFASGVAEKLVDNLSAITVQRPDGTLDVRLGQYVEPVQLQVVCYYLWSILSPEGTQITEKDLQEVGDVNQILGKYYDRRVAGVATQKKVNERLIREWFEKRLITPGGIRNMVLQERNPRAGELDDDVIQALQSDLVRVEQRGGAIWYELTHDRLVEPILESNRRWFSENLSLLQRQAVLWNEQSRNQSWLLRDEALAEVEKWAGDHRDELTDIEREFLAESRRIQAQVGDHRIEEPVPSLPQFSIDTTPVTQAVEEQGIEEPAELSPEQIAEREARLQAAIAANLLSNNRSQAVFNDKPQGEDQLGINDEVEALAETLLLRDVEPPVSVGVMGGWGSGKSFAMYLINQYVQSTRAKSIKLGWSTGDENDPKIPAFVGHIYQINFNAWTYAKSNLWASLMDTIFSCLNRQMQLERLLAHRDFSSKDGAPTNEQVRASMLAGGDVFNKTFLYTMLRFSP